MSSNLPAAKPGNAPGPVKPAQMPTLGTSTGFLMTPKSLEEAMKFADLLAKSSIVPKQYQGKPGDILVAVMMGAELGVAPLQALAGIAVINGRASIWGDLGVALVQKTKLVEYFLEDWDEAKQVSTVRIKRRGMPARIFTFSMADARRAGLAGNDTYKKYPQRMCGWRAKTYAMRSEFADALKGLLIAEEAMDLPPESEPIEMPQPLQMPRELPEQQQQEPDSAPIIHVLAAEWVKKGTRETKEGPAEWNLFRIDFDDGATCATFSSTHHAVAERARHEKLPVRYTAKPRKDDPEKLNLETVEALTAKGWWDGSDAKKQEEEDVSS